MLFLLQWWSQARVPVWPDNWKTFVGWNPATFAYA
jgi:hypothetical protein